MKNNKIEISFNQIAFENQIKSLSQNVEKYKNLLNAIEKIIGVRELKTLKEIEEFICLKSGFKNILLSATLLEISEEYRFIEANHNKLNLEVLEINEDEVGTKQSILDKVREDATIYLNDKFITEYNTLLAASKELNRLNNPNSTKFLIKSFDGKYSVSLQGLENSSRI